jgi:Kef-type K+ transport system membrane component KefB
MGMVFEGLKQPVINGYLVAGAVVGPGGLQLIKELVQVGVWLGVAGWQHG